MLHPMCDITLPSTVCVFGGR